MTFSIVAIDPENGDLGVAVASKFPSVGALVPWISTGSGAIATQSFANTKYGTEGLKILAEKSAQDTLDILINNDPGRESRQVGIVDLNGNAVTYTGSECHSWAGGITGKGVACQGNILVDGKTVNEMMKSFVTTKGDLAEKLMCALEAGQNEGGDSRGQQSANLLVYRKAGGYGGGSDVYIDVRVDDHPFAVTELRRVFELYSITLLEREDPSEVTNLDGEILSKIGMKLTSLGFLDSSDYTYENVNPALLKWMGIENFENKARNDKKIWNSVLYYLLDM